jgi:hypothetical protein
VDGKSRSGRREVGHRRVPTGFVSKCKGVKKRESAEN